MSDLAAFLAATIESKVVEDLKEENDTLQAQNNRLREEINKTRASALQSAKGGGRIDITGQGGSPLYAHGLLHNAEHHGSAEEGVSIYNINLISNTQVICPISKAMDAEIHVNGIKLVTIGEYDEKDCIGTEGDDTEKLVYMFNTGCGTHWKGFCVGLYFGPFPPLRGEPRDPRDMKDEDVEEVEFGFCSIDITNEENEGDILRSIPNLPGFD